MKTVLFSIAGLIALSQVAPLLKSEPEPYMGSAKQIKTYEVLCKGGRDLNKPEWLHYCN